MNKCKTFSGVPRPDLGCPLCPDRDLTRPSDALPVSTKSTIPSACRRFYEALADAFPQVFFRIQLIDFHPHEITPRDNTPDPTPLDDWEMTKAVSAHLP